MITFTLFDFFFVFAKPDYKLHELAIFMGSDVRNEGKTIKIHLK